MLRHEYNEFALRVLPSGKAVASQATIRGFESHHPLFNFKIFNPFLPWNPLFRTWNVVYHN
jgi:hypothetical protein